MPEIEIPFVWGTIFGTDHVTLRPFGLCVAIGVLVGHWQAMRYAARRRLSVEKLSHMIGCVLVAGFVGAHLFVVLSRRRGFGSEWWTIWNGLSSFGGFLGGSAALLACGRAYRIGVLPYADAIAYGLAHGWILGRAGCTLVHDHPGRMTSFPLSIRFPEPLSMAGQRFDLGLLELLSTVVLVVVLRCLLEPHARQSGQLVAWLGLLYAPLRFGLDGLRATDVPGADERYFGLTLAQYACLSTVLILICSIMLSANLLLGRAGRRGNRTCTST
jgi:phosphatidylglycerol:prolipoprotein diacylglycerol transferase